jgi:diadenosine tetraphosphate (Ap4A) HIT family hydrolase
MTTVKGVTYGEDGGVVSCLFCRIADQKEPGDILFQNDKYVVFRNIYPVTDTHVLVTPRKHIKSFRELSGEEGAAVLADMIKVRAACSTCSSQRLFPG